MNVKAEYSQPWAGIISLDSPLRAAQAGSAPNKASGAGTVPRGIMETQPQFW